MKALSSRHRHQPGGFTLVEVMVTLFLVTMLTLAVFAGLQTLSQVTAATAIRSEAQRLLQAEAERLQSVSFGNFTSSSDQTITSSYKTVFAPGSQARFTYPTTGTAGRVTFTRRVVAVASTTTSRTLRAEVQWTWQGRTQTISVPLFRTQ